MRLVLLIGFGSFLGGISRYLLSSLIDVKYGQAPTVGTFIVNIIGCFLIGIVFAFSDRASLSQDWRFFLATGLLGGFTTFSAFSHQTIVLLQTGRIGYAFLYVAASVLIGLLATYLGLLCFRTN